MESKNYLQIGACALTCNMPQSYKPVKRPASVCSLKRTRTPTKRRKSKNGAQAQTNNGAQSKSGLKNKKQAQNRNKKGRSLRKP
jgi:hypothetical protein